eukprot:scaffold140849_cov26-Tisochrysis_lutea.AAC.1
MASKHQRLARRFALAGSWVNEILERVMQLHLHLPDLGSLSLDIETSTALALLLAKAVRQVA